MRERHLVCWTANIEPSEWVTVCIAQLYSANGWRTHFADRQKRMHDFGYITINPSERQRGCSWSVTALSCACVHTHCFVLSPRGINNLFGKDVSIELCSCNSIKPFDMQIKNAGLHFFAVQFLGTEFNRAHHTVRFSRRNAGTNSPNNISCLYIYTDVFVCSLEGYTTEIESELASLLRSTTSSTLFIHGTYLY